MDREIKKIGTQQKKLRQAQATTTIVGEELE